jgi:hypothetical protein
MKIYKKLLFAFLIIFTQLFNSCGTPTKSFTVEKNALPADFGADENCILICVLQDRNSRDYYMKKQITNEYHGKYEFVSESDLTSSKYNDKNIYKYLLDYHHSTVTQSTYNTTTHRTSTLTSGISNYYLLDRKENKEYNNKRSGSAFSKIIRAYAINLELVRLKNKKS